MGSNPIRATWDRSSAGRTVALQASDWGSTPHGSTNMKKFGIRLKAKSPRSRFVAFDSKNKVIAEGIKAKTVAKKAEKIMKEFSMIWVPKRGQDYIFNETEAKGFL